MPRSPRHAIERGISQDGNGYSVRVSVGTGPHQRHQERRFPLTASLAFLRKQRDRMEEAFRARHQPSIDRQIAMDRQRALAMAVRHVERHAVVLQEQAWALQEACAALRRLIGDN